MSDIDYDRTLGTGLVGYRYPSFDLLYAATHVAAPRSDGDRQRRAPRSAAPRLESDTRGAQLGFRFRVTERFDLEARAGRPNTRRAGAVTASKLFRVRSPGTTNDRPGSALSQDVEPSGHGMLVHAEDLQVRVFAQAHRRLTLDANGAPASRRYAGRSAPL